MLKELIESLEIRKDIRIIRYTACVTAIATYYLCDKVVFADRKAVLDQKDAVIDNLKIETHKLEMQSTEYAAALEDTKKRSNQLNNEVLRLQPYEQAFPQWKKALEDERERSSNLQDQLNQAEQTSSATKQMADSCVVDRNQLSASVTKLNEAITNAIPILDKRKEIAKLESEKNSVENTIAELDTSLSRDFNIEKIAQLKRISAEYQQQIIQLRQCAR
jgi:thioester reductase-like protein